jgi:hypothetical protein
MIETLQAYHLHKAKDIDHLNNQLLELVQIAVATLSDSQFLISKLSFLTLAMGYSHHLFPLVSYH